MTTIKSIRQQGFVFPLPPEVLQQLEEEHNLWPNPAWKQYTSPYEEFWNIKECGCLGDLAPWAITTVEWWGQCNRPLIELLKADLEKSSLGETERCLMFHLVQAFDDLVRILRTARTTWRHDPVYDFVKRSDGAEETDTDNNVNLK